MPDLVILIPVLIILIYVFSSIKILAEYERAVVFRLGRVLPQPKGPGVILVFAPIDRMVRISLRIEAMEVPPQDVVTRDNVTVKVNAVVYFRVMDPTKAVLEVTNFLYATSQVAQTTLRSALGEVELDELLSQREKLNLRLQTILDQHTSPWGIQVTVAGGTQAKSAAHRFRAICKRWLKSASRRTPPSFSPCQSIYCRLWSAPLPSWANHPNRLTHEEQRNWRIRNGAGQQTVAQRFFPCGDPLRGVFRDGLH